MSANVQVSKKFGVSIAPPKGGKTKAEPRAKAKPAPVEGPVPGPVAEKVLKSMRAGKQYRACQLAEAVAASDSRIAAILRRLIVLGKIKRVGYGVYVREA